MKLRPIISYRVIARALAASQHKRYGVEDSPNRYTDRVHRAILGQRLTFDTLELFAETFILSGQSIEEISKYIATDDISRDSTKVANRNRFITPTSTIYDIYLDENLVAYKIDSTIIVRAVANHVGAIGATNSDDITGIDLLECGTSS